MTNSMRWLSALVFAVLLTAGQPAAAFDSCRAVDFNGDGTVDLLDVAILSAAVGTADPRVDVDGDALVGDADASIFLAFLNQTCSDCTADLDGSGAVDAADRTILESAYGTACRGDLNGDSVVDKGDVDLFVIYLTSPASPATDRADFNGDGVADLGDVGLLTAMLGNDCTADLNKDGEIDANDLWALLASWGSCPI